MTVRLSRSKRFVQGMALLPCFASGLALAEMQSLDDDVLAGVSGQSGLTLDMAANVSIAELAYFDDDNGLALQGVRLASALDPDDYARMRLRFDLVAAGDLALSFKSDNVARFEIDDIRFVDASGVSPVAAAPSLGGFFLDFSLDGSLAVENIGNAQLAGAVQGGRYDIDLTLNDGRLGYRSNGNELFFDGMTLAINSQDTVLGANAVGDLVLDLPNFLAELSVEAIRFSDNPNNHGVSTDQDSGSQLPSYGSLWAKLDASSQLQIGAGGRLGSEGLTLNSQTTINRLDLLWGDDTDWSASGYWAGVLGVSGQVDVTNLSVDVLADPDALTNPAKDYGLGLALDFERIEAKLTFQDIVLGETKAAIDAAIAGAGTIASVGGLTTNLVFADASFGGRDYQNRVYIQAGGNRAAGYQGLRFDAELSLISPNNESHLIYTEDGNSVMLSGLSAYADGDLTLDVTREQNLAGEQYYDGLRLGFEDFAFGYQVEGLRLAKADQGEGALKSARLQSAQKINGFQGGSFALLGAPVLEGTLNGHITMAPGGNVGQEGITINADVAMTDGDMALYLEDLTSTRGLWLSGLNYDVHLRDMMLDVTDEGLRIFEAESWSKLDVTDFRVGERASGASFGRLVLETHEQGSVTTLSAGGAGALCLGAVATDESACNSAGGRWEDRGVQGLTISSRRFFKQSTAPDGRRNRFTWETKRNGEGATAVANNTGLQLVFDNFSTNDGDGLTDSYGFRSDTSIDVASAYVRKKADGADANGVAGNKGDIKVMNADGSYRYVAPAALTAQDRANLPLGFATRTRTHFKELDFERVNLVHSSGESDTLLYGLKVQNLDVTTDLNVTPLD